MPDRPGSSFTWNILSLLLIATLAVLPPIREIHKQLILLAIALTQIFEGRLLAIGPRLGPSISVLLKIALSTVLLFHTGDTTGGEPDYYYNVGINSAYYPIFYLPVITAAIYFGPVLSLLWALLSSAAYCSLLYPALALMHYELTPGALSDLALRVVFFFFAAVLVNRFAVENRTQVRQYQAVSETLAETNRQLRHAEEEKRRSERLAALGQLSAGLAHEMRNPLGVIKGSAEMLEQRLQAGPAAARGETQGQPALAAELAGYISSEVNRLNELVARFLDFARPLRPELQAAELPPILDRALAAVEAQFPEAEVRIEREFAAGLPTVLVDPPLCEHVFINLVTNAFQAMNGRGTLRLETAAEESAGTAFVRVVIEDSGPGIPAENREQIFNPFFTSKKQGMGLGLSIVAKIMDEHHGSIRLDSSERGARFRLLFPGTAETASPRQGES